MKRQIAYINSNITANKTITMLVDVKYLLVSFLIDDQ